MSTLGIAPATRLDGEIVEIRHQISSLTRRRSALTTSIMGARATNTLLGRCDVSSRQARLQRSLETTTEDTSPLLAAALDQSTKQVKHRQQCLYRLGAGATMFEVKDPDPNAVGNGRVLGVRIEVFVDGRFLPPYYLFLNRLDSTSPSLRIHRSTIPACIPLSALSARYLPQPASTMAGDVPKPSPKQNLPRLVRELRRELVSYHLRCASIICAQRWYKLDDGGNAKTREHGIKSIAGEDAGFKDIRLEWANGKIGRVRVGKDGLLQKCVVFGDEGRERHVERQMMAGTRRLEDLRETLMEVESM